MGHHHPCRTVLAVTFHRLVFSCELADAVETHKEGIPVPSRGVSMSLKAMFQPPPLLISARRNATGEL
jgi:hypothetical protein